MTGKKPELTPARFRELVEEGQKLAQEFGKRSKSMRQLTPEDWQRRCKYSYRLLQQ